MALDLKTGGPANRPREGAPHFIAPLGPAAQGYAARPMSSSAPYLVRMAVFLAALAAALAALLYFNYDALWSAFNHNPILNGAIVGVFVLGVLYVLRQVQRLGGEAAWVNHIWVVDEKHQSSKQRPTSDERDFNLHARDEKVTI